MYRRLVLKLSGRSIAGSAQFGFNSDSLTHLAREVIAARDTGVQVAVVVGGGNVFRGNRSEDWGIDRGRGGQHRHARHGDQCRPAAGPAGGDG